MSRAPVAVVVVSWNAARDLTACLDSVRAQTRRPAEVLVVDNASTDGSARLVAERHPDVRLFAMASNLGYCVANNLGFDATTQPFVLALNPDTELEPDFLERLLPAFEDPQVGLACGKLLRFDRRTLDSAGQQLGRSRRPVDRGYGRPDDGRYDRDETVFGACGAAALYRRRMLEAVRDEDGYFDPEFFAFWEDLDLAWRAGRLGWRAEYRHRAVGYHARGASADRRHPLRRFAALLGRRPAIQYHIVKNRYLTILRNDRPGAYLRDAPWIWARDVGYLALALASPSVLIRLWRGRRLLRRALARRRLDARRARHQVGPGEPVGTPVGSRGSR